MKSIYLIFARILVLCGCFCLIHCKKFVQIDPPTTQIVSTSVFSSNATATAAQIAIYAKMVSSESALLAINTGLLGDELTNYTTNQSYTQFYTNAMVASGSPGPWVNAYNYIYQANTIIENLQNNQSISPAVEQQLIGESKFIRAFWLFYLTNLYGDIPIVVSSNYKINAIIPRSPQTKVYQQIISDLKDAQGLLSSNYIDASDTSVTKERTRPTKWAAIALLARVYLYIGDWSDAEAQANAVISNSALYSLCSNLSNVFLVNSTEAIWQLAIPIPGPTYTTDGLDFIMISAPGNSAVCCSISSQLLASFDSGDARRTNWIGSFKTTTTPAKIYYFPWKYKARSGTSITEYVMVFRLAEQYLIRAEARAEQNNLNGAIADINVIRGRAGLTGYSTTSLSQSQTLSAIVHERQAELFTEWGHRWLDLKRTRNLDAVMSVVTPQKGGKWYTDGHQQLFPIPQSNINVDVNLTQNAGY